MKKQIRVKRDQLHIVYCDSSAFVSSAKSRNAIEISSFAISVGGLCSFLLWHVAEQRLPRPGDHFFVNTHRFDVLDLLRQTLSQKSDAIVV